MATAGNDELEGLVRKSVDGDRSAFSQIVRLLMKQVTALTYRMTGDRDIAFDLAQETFVTAWQRLDTFRGEAKLESWIYRIAANRCLNYLKGAQKHAHTLSPINDTAVGTGSDVDSPDRILEKKQLRQDVLEFMGSLPEQQRLVFDLRFYSELQFGEIATILGKAIGTVKTNYREAVGKLREHAVARGWRH